MDKLASVKDQRLGPLTTRPLSLTPTPSEPNHTTLESHTPSPHSPRLQDPDSSPVLSPTLEKPACPSLHSRYSLRFLHVSSSSCKRLSLTGIFLQPIYLYQTHPDADTLSFALIDHHGVIILPPKEPLLYSSRSTNSPPTSILAPCSPAISIIIPNKSALIFAIPNSKMAGGVLLAGWLTF